MKMKRTDFNIIWGILLIVAGILFLLQTNGLLGDTSSVVWQIIWAIAFAAAGLAFAWRFLADRTGAWWAAIPGSVLLALALLLTLDLLGLAEGNAAWLGSVFLGLIGLSFWVIYFTHREFWWAVIPGGVLLTLALVALMATWYTGEVVGSIFFFGMAATFGLVYLLPTPFGRMTWALIPAGVLAVLGLALLMAFTAIFEYIWAVVLILVGLYLLLRPRGGEMRRHS
jgi:hypothetical protein